MKPNCSVLISTCDKYSDLWVPNIRLLEKYWGDCPFEIYLTSESYSETRIGNVNLMNLGKDLDWSSLLIKALKVLKSDYVLFTLDDFLLRRKVNTKEILNLLVAMDSSEINMMRLTPRPGPDYRLKNIASYGAIAINAQYRVSTQASLWKKEALLKILQNGESPWEFEKKGAERAKNIPNFYSVWKSPFPYYHHAIQRGKWFPWDAVFFKRMNIEVDLKKRKIMSSSEVLSYISRKIFDIVIKIFPNNFIANIKKFIKKC